MERQIDSLKLIIRGASHDTTVVQTLINWDNLIYISDPELDLELNLKIDSIAKSNLSVGQDPRANYVFSQSRSFALNNLGAIAQNRGDYIQAINYHDQALKISEKVGDKKGIATALNNIAIINLSQGNREEAVNHFKRSLTIREELGDKNGIANSLNNLGNIFSEDGKLKQALDYYSRSLELEEKSGNKKGIAVALNNMGIIHKEQGNFQTAIKFYKKALVLLEAIGDERSTASTMVNIGSIYIEMNSLTQAAEYSSRALSVATTINDPKSIRDASSILWKIYKKTGDYAKALEMHELYMEMRDTIVREENQKEVIRQKLRYQYEKQAAEDSIKNAEAQKLQEARLAAKNAEAAKDKLKIEQQEKQQMYLYIGLSLVALFGLFMYNRFRITRRQKNIINSQKELVEEQHEQVATQKEKIERQHKELEGVHQEISDSIRYAQRLQLAILPDQEDMKAYLKDAFVLFLPKDVVSGDFYWMQTVGDQVLFAVADCTGHGVPGALVSVVCSNALNRVVKEFEILEPAQILNKTRELVIETFARSGQNVKDGMDIALCRLLPDGLQFAGANNPLWIVRKKALITEEERAERSTVILGDMGLIELKASKQPVGLYERMSEFEEQSTGLHPGDTIYIFTDGFADQFGGDRNKKLMYKPFKKLLISLNHLPMNEQKEKLAHFFQDWRGANEQVDDVCIVGVRI